MNELTVFLIVTISAPCDPRKLKLKKECLILHFDPLPRKTGKSELILHGVTTSVECPKKSTIRIFATKKHEKMLPMRIKWVARSVFQSDQPCLPNPNDDFLGKRYPIPEIGELGETAVGTFGPAAFAHTLEITAKGTTICSTRRDSVDEFLDNYIRRTCPAVLRKMFCENGFQVTYDPITDFVTLIVSEQDGGTDEVKCTLLGDKIHKDEYEGIIRAFISNLLYKLESGDHRDLGWSGQVELASNLFQRLLWFNRWESSDLASDQSLGLEGALQMFRPFVQLVVDPLLEFFTAKLTRKFHSNRLSQRPMPISTDIRSKLEQLSLLQVVIDNLETLVRNRRPSDKTSYPAKSQTYARDEVKSWQELPIRFEMVPDLLGLILASPVLCKEYHALLSGRFAKYLQSRPLVTVPDDLDRLSSGIPQAGLEWVGNSVQMLLRLGEPCPPAKPKATLEVESEMESPKPLTSQIPDDEVVRLRSLLDWQDTAIYDAKGVCTTSGLQSLSYLSKSRVSQVFSLGKHTFVRSSYADLDCIQPKLFFISHDWQTWREFGTPQDHVDAVKLMKTEFNPQILYSDGVLARGGHTKTGTLMLVGIGLDQFRDDPKWTAKPLFFRKQIQAADLPPGTFKHCAFTSRFWLLKTQQPLSSAKPRTATQHQGFLGFLQQFDEDEDSGLRHTQVPDKLLCVPIVRGEAFGEPYSLDFLGLLPKNTQRYVHIHPSGAWRFQAHSGSATLYYTYYNSSCKGGFHTRLYAGIIELNLKMRDAKLKSESMFDLVEKAGLVFLELSKQLDMRLFVCKGLNYILLEFKQSMRVLLVHWKGSLHWVKVNRQKTHNNPFSWEYYSALGPLGVAVSSPVWLYRQDLPSGGCKLYRLRYCV